MAHFARIENGIVVEVIRVENDCAPDEKSGIDFIHETGLSGEWVQTSYNGNPIEGKDRGPYAGIGYTYDKSKFAPPVGPKIVIEGIGK